MMRKLVTLCCCTLLWAAAAFAQAPAPATLHVTVLDETRGVLPGAAVTLTAVDAANRTAEIGPTLASQQGQVTFE